MTPDITLDSGRVVTHKRITDDAIDTWLQAFPTTGNEELTEPEWQQYCQIIKERLNVSPN